MAGKNTTQVRIGAPVSVGGYGKYAPIGTARPTDAKTALNASYLDFGYISDAGIEVKTDNGTDKIKDWNQDVVAIIQKSNECTISFELLQISPETARLIFGEDNVVTTGSGPDEKVTRIDYTGKLLKAKQFAFLLEDINGPMILDIADGTCTGMDGFKLTKTDVISFKVDLELRKDQNGRFFALLMSDGAA